MRIAWSTDSYHTTILSNREEGWSAVQLYKDCDGKTLLAARVVFWDAEGHYQLEMEADEVPVTIIEALIAEAKALIRID